MKLAVLASGKGTVLSAIIDAGLRITVVIVDRPCDAAKIAEHAGIPVEIVERTDFRSTFDRVSYTARVVDVLDRFDVELIAMAGFMTILGSAIHDRYRDRILNTHPSLLPAFKGGHAVRDALAAGAIVSGCTVHLATLEVDEGPILAQSEVPVRPDDTEESLHERIKAVERTLYPSVISTYLVQLERSGGRQ